MDHSNIENEMEDFKMEHSKIEMDNPVNDCDNVQNLESQMHSELDSLNHSNTTGYDSTLLLQHHNNVPNDDITIHLASSGMAGVAAAAAIATSQRKSMLYNFETVPAVRKRHSTRLLRKIQQLVDEFSVRVGQQACLLVFGASPLDNVLRNLREVITQDLETSLQNYQIMNANINYYQHAEILPPLMVDGIPTPLDKMTQAQLRAFIPVMLKYSTGRTKPAWGRPASRPPWWPDDVPWANVRSDVRTEAEKQSQTWTNALKKVVRCCYEYHGKSHYLHDYATASAMTGGDMMDHHGQMMDHTQLMEIEGHHQTNVDYNNAHEHMQNQVSGRHILLNEQDAVEAQLRALSSSYAMPGGHDGNMLMNLDGDEHDSQQDDSLQMTGGNMNEFGLNGDPNMRGDGQHIKVEDLVNLPPGAVVQLDSNSTAELFSYLTSKGATNNHHHQVGGGGNVDVSSASHDRNHQMQDQTQMEHQGSGGRATRSHNREGKGRNTHLSTRNDVI